MEGNEEHFEPDVFHMGPGTLRISRRELHGKIRSRLQEHMNGVLAQDKRGIVLLQGGTPFHLYTSDTEMLFKQEAYFHYLFGVQEEDWWGALDLRTGHAILFMPRLPESYAVWMGALKSPEQNRQRFAVHAVHYVDEMAGVLQHLGAPCLHLLSGENTDSGSKVTPPTFEGIDQFQVDTDSLFEAITECRVRKLPEEIEIIRYANRVGSEAHIAMMKMARPGVMEYQLESTFLHHAYMHGGCRIANYTPISASGPNGAILHYGHAGAPNDRQLRAGDLVLADMGCEYYRYGSDITATWPASGEFSSRQRVVYGAVLAAQDAVKAAMRPGVAWPDMHALANRLILEGLLADGLVQGSVDDMMDACIGALFMPHGLGHFLGLDVHDVGGYPPKGPKRSPLPGFNRLRTARHLEAGMVITVEPGCYFNPVLLLPAFESDQAKFLVPEVIKEYMDFGGVRLEDNVVVTPTGAESLTHLPRTMADIEAVMKGREWKV